MSKLKWFWVLAVRQVLCECWWLTCRCCMLYRGETESEEWNERLEAVACRGKDAVPNVPISSFRAYIYVPQSQWRPPKVCSVSRWSRRERTSSSWVFRLIHNGRHLDMRVQPWEQHLISWRRPLASFRLKSGRALNRREWCIISSLLFSFHFMIDRSMPAPIRLIHQCPP